MLQCNKCRECYRPSLEDIAFNMEQDCPSCGYVNTVDLDNLIRILAQMLIEKTS